jgi:hypothetical protein
MLWLDHVDRYLKDRDQLWPWVTVSYDRFLSDPLQELNRIGAALDLALQRDATVRFMDRINPGLRHYQVIGCLSLPSEVAATWSEAQDRAAT